VWSIVVASQLASAAEPEMIPEAAWAAVTQVTSPTDVDLSLPLRGGGTFSLAEHRGKRVLLAFWASWCAPCRRELPALDVWAKAHPDIVTLTINVDRTENEASRFLSQVGFDLPVAFAHDAAQLGQFGVTSMPTMFLVDTKGDVVWRHTGYSEDTGFAELDQAVSGKVASNGSPR
jgi:thiol-disulfide isomerase/thioredoxin